MSTPEQGALLVSPGSFSTLILPFAYSLSAIAASNGATPRWRELTPSEEDQGAHQSDQAARVRYFTNETAQALFGPRTKRFRLDPATPTSPIPTRQAVPTENDQHVHGIPVGSFELMPPELLLFEFDPKEKPNDNPMRVGLLQLKFRVTNPDTIHLWQLCRFNELIRFFKLPFKEKGRFPLLHWLLPWLGNIAATTDNIAEPWFLLLAQQLELPGGGHCKLFPANWYSNGMKWVRGEDTNYQPHPMIFPDDRAFVWSAAVVPSLGPGVEGAACLDQQAPENTRGWLALLNVDDASSDSKLMEPLTKAFEATFVQNHTYMRWAPFSLYGFTPHSGIALLPAWAEPPLSEIFERLYFEQSRLLIYLRSALFSFSRRISIISSEMQQKRLTIHQPANKFIDLEKEFSIFTNLYQFPMLSHQQQGVELYDLQRKALGVNELFREIQQKIHHMDEMLDRRHDRIIRNVGAIFTVVTIVGALWSDLGFADYFQNLPALAGQLIVTAGVGILIYITYVRASSK